MLTVLYLRGWRFHFYSNEGNELIPTLKKETQNVNIGSMSIYMTFVKPTFTICPDEIQEKFAKLFCNTLMKL